MNTKCFVDDSFSQKNLIWENLYTDNHPTLKIARGWWNEEMLTFEVSVKN